MVGVERLDDLPLLGAQPIDGLLEARDPRGRVGRSVAVGVRLVHPADRRRLAIALGLGIHVTRSLLRIVPPRRDAASRQPPPRGAS
jgi:hypothetical protein